MGASEECVVPSLKREGKGLSLYSEGMDASEVCVVPRLKREECLRTKHDSNFSKWKILVGPSDWEDYSLGKEGAARYRLHNLPTCSGPGLYELGIAVSHTDSGREVGKLDPHRIVVVYLGQAENVRTRLQAYGRSGAHLCKTYSTAQLQNRPRLLEEIFSKGSSLVFRWAPMNNKRDAEKTESRLLNTFDYAWNKGYNGLRRRNDVLQKLDKISSSTTWFPKIARKLQTFNQKQVGIKIEARKPLLQQNKSSACTDEESNGLLPQVFKFGRSRPRFLLVRSQVSYQDSSLPTCGVNLDDGTPCRRPPVPGRKRCEEHKGRRISGSISNSVTAKKSSYVHDVVLDSSSHNDKDYMTCGITLDDGTPCRRPPVSGRKRCEEHKGRRIHGSISNSVAASKASCLHDVVLDSSSHDDPVYMTCEVDLGNGIYCRRQPIAGRKRCEEHKGMKVNGLVSKLAGEDKSHMSDVGLRLNTSHDFSIMCGATTLDGSLCSRKPAEGGKRCWQHKGMKGDFSFCSFDTGSSLVCGAPLRNGSVCMRDPVHGRKRCAQHKGMRGFT